MAGDHSRGVVATGCLILVCLLVPVAGHIILALMILQDDLTGSEKLLWLILSLVLWPVGALLYLLMGQRRDRLFGQRAY